LRAKDREVILGIRPEHIYNKNLKGELKGAEAIQVNIDVVEPIGKEIILLASSGEIQFSICVDLQTNVRPHDTMEMLVDMNYMHIFSKETEEVY